ncbi:TetR/AcrR family transcriptional regulator [bacterium]|nr:TetR/AcrR family transcriptional regulator [bacterium]
MPKTANASPQAAKPRAPRRSRAVCEELLLQAAEDLLAKNSPADITIRDIAAKATVHHRFISTWFVGKVELFTIVHQRISPRTRTLARNASLTTPSSVSELNLQLGLALWLIQNGVKFKSTEEAFPAIGAAIERSVQELGMSHRDSEIVAHTVGSMVLANFILQPHVASTTSLEELLGHYGKLLRQK